jgi:carboxypeptidase family protein
MTARLPGLLALMLITGAARAVPGHQALSSHTLVGAVTDTGGTPLPGATVELSQAASTNSVRTMTTGADGTYRIERILPGLYVLTIRLGGFGPVIRDLEIGGDGEEFRFDVQLQPLLPGTRSPGPSASFAPDRRVVCGLTMITPQNPDLKILAPNPPGGAPYRDRLVPVPPRPQGAPAVKGTMRTVQPTMCWDPVTPAR